MTILFVARVMPACRAFSFSRSLSSIYYVSRESCLYTREKREWEWEGRHWQTEREGSSAFEQTRDTRPPVAFVPVFVPFYLRLLTLLLPSLSFVSFYNRSDVAGKDFWPGLITPEMKYYPFSICSHGKERSICEDR